MKFQRDGGNELIARGRKRDKLSYHLVTTLILKEFFQMSPMLITKWQ